jgi:Mn2+/Fe2+ NRAMP family transporter
MLFSNAIALGIVVATAVTPNLHGITNIRTSDQAVEALRPVAGDFAFAALALGVIGTGLLAAPVMTVPVLPDSAACAVSEVSGRKSGLSQGFHASSRLGPPGGRFIPTLRIGHSVVSSPDVVARR